MRCFDLLGLIVSLGFSKAIDKIEDREEVYYLCKGCGSSFGIPIKRDYRLMDEEK